MIREIQTIGDVAIYMQNIIEEGVNAHPDELFENYINIKTGEPSYSVEEAASRNLLMIKSFEVCEKASVDIYSLMHEIFLLQTGLYRFIPLPSSLGEL